MVKRVVKEPYIVKETQGIIPNNIILKGRQSALDEMRLQLEKYYPFIHVLRHL